MSQPSPPFHLALPVHSLESARAFYGGLLQCAEGRSAERWIDYNFWGHQISVHLDESMEAGSSSNEVDGDAVPVRHFGAILRWADWEALAQRLEAAAWPFLIPPRVRFAGEAGEQGTFFLKDPSGNALEFKSFQDPSRVFLRDAD